MDPQKILAAASETLRSGALAEAEKECRSVLAVFPRHHGTLVVLAQVLGQTGRETEAQAVSHWAELATPGVTSRFTARATERFRAAFGPAVLALEPVHNKRRVQMRSLGQN